MLTGSKARLRSPREDDKNFLVGLRNDVPLQMLLMALPRANSSSRVDEWVARLTDDPASLFFVVADKETDKAVGYIQLTKMDFVHGHGELGICLGEENRGRGYAADALALLERHARSVFNIRKIVLYCLASNERAIGFYKKTGYESVGILKEHFYQEGAFRDVLIMEKHLR
jgi:diamine N-acetyltransferase